MPSARPSLCAGRRVRACASLLAGPGLAGVCASHAQLRPCPGVQASHVSFLSWDRAWKRYPSQWRRRLWCPNCSPPSPSSVPSPQRGLHWPREPPQTLPECAGKQHGTLRNMKGPARRVCLGPLSSSTWVPDRLLWGRKHRWRARDLPRAS